MEPDSRPLEETSEKPADRDEQGHFIKGHKVGKDHRWTKEDHPVSPGRPKSKTMTDALLVHLNKKASELEFARKAAKSMKMNPETSTVLEILVATYILNGMKGKGDISKEMWARIEGAIPKHVTLASDDPVLEYMAQQEAATAPPPPDPEESPAAEEPESSEQPKESDDTPPE